jgi:hypothetical protein
MIRDLLVGNADVHFARLGGVAAAVGHPAAGVVFARLGAELVFSNWQR